jgi:chemotaxis regulatin CheY-phosphate phosphatase CheZ
MTTTSRAQEVLYESEAALRLVDNGIDDLRGAAQPAPQENRLMTVSLGDLPLILERANQQIQNVLAHLRQTRSALQSTAFEKLQATHDKIREVTSATEDAAINIMDACDRANNIVDELDAIDAAETPDKAQALNLRSTLRDEIFLMMGALQFQDITSQQLSHASAVLVEMESRLAEVAALFDSGLTIDRPTFTNAPAEQTYDPNATTRNAEGRQALADGIFTSIRVPAA